MVQLEQVQVGPDALLGDLGSADAALTITGTRRQAGVLGQDLGGLLPCNLVAASRRRVFATGTLIAVGRRLMP